MPFEKNNKYWREGIKVRQANKDKLDYFLGVLANGGTDKYGDLMDKLATGEKLTDAEIEYMDRFEGWREYVKPKLARTEGSIKHTGSISLGKTLDDTDAADRQEGH